MPEAPLWITDEIFQVGGARLTAPSDAAIYVLRLQDRAVVIDAGCGGAQDRLLANLAWAGVKPADIEMLLLTHCHYDHTGGARSLRDRFGWRVVLHEGDARFLEEADQGVTAASWYGARLRPCAVDHKLAGGEEVIQLGERPIRAVHIPGHSPGSVAYVVVSGGLTVVFAQDVHGPLHSGLLSDAEAYQASLRRLLELNADILCEGHFGVFHGKTAVRRFVRSFLRANEA